MTGWIVAVIFFATQIAMLCWAIAMHRRRPREGRDEETPTDAPAKPAAEGRKPGYDCRPCAHWTPIVSRNGRDLGRCGHERFGADRTVRADRVYQAPPCRGFELPSAELLRLAADMIEGRTLGIERRIERGGRSAATDAHRLLQLVTWARAGWHALPATAPGNGVYRVRGPALDKEDRLVVVGQYASVSGGVFAPWRELVESEIEMWSAPDPEVSP